MPTQSFAGPELLPSSAATLYTCPSGVTATVRRLRVNNPTASPVNFTLAIGDDGPSTRLWDAVSIPAGGSLSDQGPVTLQAGQIIQAFASTGSALVLELDGEENQASLITYTSTFPGTENPISEGGKWQNNGLIWTPVRTEGGLAFGTQVGGAGGPYNDSYACLYGFPTSHAIEAVVFKGAASGSQEVELLLHWTTAPGVTHGYECLWAHDGSYSDIVRWDAATPTGTGFGDGFTRIISGPGGFSINTGDVVRAEISGTAISCFLNGVPFMSCDIVSDNPGGPVWTQGNPGIGFFWEAGAGANDAFAFTSVAAEGL